MSVLNRLYVERFSSENEFVENVITGPFDYPGLDNPEYRVRFSNGLHVWREVSDNKYDYFPPPACSNAVFRVSEIGLLPLRFVPMGECVFFGAQFWVVTWVGGIHSWLVNINGVIISAQVRTIVKWTPQSEFLKRELGGG